MQDNKRKAVIQALYRVRNIEFIKRTYVIKSNLIKQINKNDYNPNALGLKKVYNRKSNYEF